LEKNFDAWRGKIPAQYDYAVIFGQGVKKLYPRAAVTAAGHSKGGGQATYASQQTLGIYKVITINSARPPFVDHPSRRVRQINVIVPGEVIGDPNSVIGGLLPGKYFGVNLNADRPTLIPTVIKAGVIGASISAASAAKRVHDAHSVEAVIGGVREVLNPKPSATPSVNVPSATAPTKVLQGNLRSL
jgi:hypothetical protein